MGNIPVKFNNLQFRRIVVHEILLASDLERGRTPQQSDLFLELDPKGEALLSKRFVDSLGSESHSIALDVEFDREGSCFDLLTKLFEAKDKGFISATKQLAVMLTKAQTSGSIKSGLAVFIDGSMGGKNERRRFVAVLKAESDSGFQKQITDQAVLLKYVADMVLGAQQRLYKLGCFVENLGCKPERNAVRSKHDFEVVVYDHLVSNSGDSNAARYFYGTFLGCKLSDNAPRLTRIFYQKTSEFIDEQKFPTEKKVEAKSHLVSYLRSPQTTISAKEYADRYFEPALRDVYLKSVYKDATFPKRDISKDNSQIARKLQVRRMLFTSKVRIIAPAQGFKDLVDVVESKEGWTTVRINGDIKAQT